MCWMCDQDGRANLTDQYWANRLGVSAAEFAAASGGGKNYTSLLPRDNVGDYKAELPFQQTLVTGLLADEAGSGIGVAPGNPTITVGGASIQATLQTIGDEDYFAVTLVAGKTYEIGQYALVAGPSGIPLADAFFEIYDASGKLLLQVDGGGPNTPQGLDALSTFTAASSGVYYINARAFDQDGTVNGTKGDAVGDYELFVREAPAGQPAYQPFYSPDSPLHSLDWGSEFKRSSRNPDSDNGTRTDNGVTQQDMLTDYRTGIEGKNVITYYFAKKGDAFLSEDPTTPGLTADIVQARDITGYERDAYRLAFQQYENVADVVYVEVQNRNEADLKIITYVGTPGPGASLLGRASPPGEESEGQMEYNAGDERYNPAGLTQGGFFFTTLLHEFGHAHGMAHPHDNGGRSSIMRGAGGGTAGLGGAYGDFGLSQGVFTVMSYNDGYDLRPDMNGAKPDDSADNGWVGTLSPLDIAVIQDKYGVNEEYNKGDDTYVLRDVQETGTFYAAIWDGGGTDEIVYAGNRAATVDLRPATLKYEEGGGGRVSYVAEIHGGFTIANGVTIENVRTGGGNDVVTGNDAANKLETGAGDDIVVGGGGNDLIDAGAGYDLITGGAGEDTFLFASAADSGTQVPGSFDRITDFEKGVDKIDLEGLDVGSFAGRGNFSNTAGELRFGTFGGDTLVQFDADGDGDADFNLMLTGLHNLTPEDFIGVASGPSGSVLTGTANADNLVGRDGNEILIGLGGNDTLNGGGGSDTADYSATASKFKIDLDVTTAQATGTSGSDTLISIENLIGGAGINTFLGSAGANRLDGGGGNDVLDGRGGDDVLVGGLGKDKLTGRLGVDVFEFDSTAESGLGANADIITDFKRGLDKIDLSGIDAISGGGDDAFTFIGSNGFSNQAGQLRYSSTAAGTVLAGDVNGDSVADFEIILSNKAIPTGADFLL